MWKYLAWKENNQLFTNSTFKFDENLVQIIAENIESFIEDTLNWNKGKINSFFEFNDVLS